MEHSRGLIYCNCISIVAAAMNGWLEASKQFKVGDHISWQQPTPMAINIAYVAAFWCLAISHSLLHAAFEFDGNDSVLVVDKWDYYQCNSNNPVYSLKDGNVVVNLDRPGSLYFISGILHHCKNGERLMIKVMGLHQRPKPPPAIANPHEAGLAPASHPSSGLVVTVSLTSLFLALIVTVLALV
ncbi:Cell division protein ftsH, putative isoform 1 [Hibiscus syriacus]|uniref:Cell division protein ftsH, putative isoform 1 n=1 Tax=Hibiscus syriacus TaxID=106335 RepID=A0A6A2WEQ6_HIBSY|nr:Cell division protein ftsH, putative isoform 1 [Hibiscus syriacus]